MRTPLVRLEAEYTAAEIHLKLENLQPIGSFKIRGAASVLGLASREALSRGIWTASAGNMAQGVGRMALSLDVTFTVVAPDHASPAKLEAIERQGGRVIAVPFDQWLEVIKTHHFEGLEGVFVHPVSDPAVMAGNATIGLEIVEDLPDVDTVVVPYGGGGLSCGIAMALRWLRPQAKVVAAEVETAAPLSASLAAGRPVEVPHKASFVDGIGAPFLLPEMWPLARELLAGSAVVGLDAIADAIRLLAQRHQVVAEGAGAAPVAAALAGKAGAGRVVCVVSGGNIDATRLSKILAGGTPED